MHIPLVHVHTLGQFHPQASAIVNIGNHVTIPPDALLTTSVVPIPFISIVSMAETDKVEYVSQKYMLRCFVHQEDKPLAATEPVVHKFKTPDEWFFLTNQVPINISKEAGISFPGFIGVDLQGKFELDEAYTTLSIFNLHCEFNNVVNLVTPNGVRPNGSLLA